MTECQKVVQLSSLSSPCDQAGPLIKAATLLSRKIRVNAVSPGAIDTPIHGVTGDERVESAKKQLASYIPLGHLGAPADIAQAVLYLASERTQRILRLHGDTISSPKNHFEYNQGRNFIAQWRDHSASTGNDDDGKNEDRTEIHDKAGARHQRA
jgi:hypothetical protein